MKGTQLKKAAKSRIFRVKKYFPIEILRIRSKKKIYLQKCYKWCVIASDTSSVKKIFIYDQKNFFKLKIIINKGQNKIIWNF